MKMKLETTHLVEQTSMMIRIHWTSYRINWVKKEKLLIMISYIVITKREVTI